MGTYRVQGHSKESGEPVEVYIVGAESEGEAVDLARSRGIVPNKVDPIFSAFIPDGAQVIEVMGSGTSITGQTASLEAIANSALIRNPIATLVTALVVAWVITTILGLILAAMMPQ